MVSEKKSSSLFPGLGPKIVWLSRPFHETTTEWRTQKITIRLIFPSEYWNFPTIGYDFPNRKEGVFSKVLQLHRMEWWGGSFAPWKPSGLFLLPTCAARLSVLRFLSVCFSVYLTDFLAYLSDWLIVASRIPEFFFYFLTRRGNARGLLTKRLGDSRACTSIHSFCLLTTITRMQSVCFISFYFVPPGQNFCLLSYIFLTLF